MTTTLITGGLSGIGEEISKQLAGKIIRTTSRRDRVDHQSGIYYFNLKELTSAKELTDDLKKHNIQIDQVFHCAYDFSDAKLFFSLKSQDLKSKFDANIIGTFELLKAIIKPMTRRGQGRILILGSLLAKIPAPGKLIYITEKSAIEAMAMALNSEVNSKGVIVKVIHPALVATDQVKAKISIDVIDKIGKENLLSPKLVATECIKFLADDSRENIDEIRGNQKW